jgi:hypothetical protein
MNSSLRAAGLSGVLFGAAMAPFYAWQQWSLGLAPGFALLLGLLAGVGSGLAFGGLTWAFLRTRWVRAQIDLQPQDLLPGERLLASRLANLVVDPARFGLRPFVFGDLGFLLGMKGKEVVGGALHLTNLRLLFKTHRLNRLHGAVSLFLPSIVAVEESRLLVMRRLRLRTESMQLEFNLLDVEGLRTPVECARADFGADEQAALAKLQQQLDGLDTLKPDAAIDRINTVLHYGRKSQDVVQAAAAPLVAIGSLLASEVFDRTLAERWSRWLRR